MVLEVDHVVPRCDGGNDELPNLLTSCATCNRGKGTKHLNSPVSCVSAERSEELKERALQAESYAEAICAQQNSINSMIDLINDYWCIAFQGERTDNGWILPERSPGFPNASSLKTFLKKLPFESIIEAIDIAAARPVDRWWRTTRYFYGVCWRMISETE